MKSHILLIKYKYDPFSWLIRKTTKSYWNHVAWILNNKLIINTGFRGLEIIPDKFSNSLNFITQKLYIKDLTKEQEIKIVTYLLSQYPKSTFLQKFLMFISILNNYNYNFTAITCSGFIAKAIATCGLYFKNNKNIKFITPEDIYQSELTDINYE